MNITIESPSKDGVIVSNGTTVKTQHGLEINDITGLTIEYPLNGIVTAKIDIAVNAGTLRANPMLQYGSLLEALDYYGLKAVPK